ncbi:MAG: GH3 auxin-responsive promoter family protein [Saprospiraceae bacterium]|nr:GH3 auxin-responsive promoter family protein [Saprospiraceae bacterium]
MSVIGKLLHTGIKLAPKHPLIQIPSNQQQIKTLHRLLKSAAHTAFGRRYDFRDLMRMKDPRKEFRTWIPIYSYESMVQNWWNRSRNDEPDVSWPGIIPYYGVSSGSVQSSSKYIPITHESLNAWNRCAQKLFSSLWAYPEITPSLLGKQALLVGGSSKLIKEGIHFYGDCSGIMAKNRPYWLRSLYKPDQQILEIPDWKDRIQAIARAALDWDIAFLVGNVAWVQLILEKIIEQYGLDHIHQIWPNLTLFSHSGIFFEPYRESFERTLQYPLIYLNVYSATEGVIAFQDRSIDGSLKLMLQHGIYFEFIPFNNDQFDDEGNLKSEFPECLPIEEVQENIPYALVISTTSGAWHYLLGDVICFTDKYQAKIKMIGRTKQNLNLTGEHLSEGNIRAAIQHVNQSYPYKIKEFCVIGEKSGTHFGHRWYLGMDTHGDPYVLAQIIDHFLKKVNDDYAIQRQALLHQNAVDILPVNTFYLWLQERGKMNGQAKIPRILTGSLKESWMQFVTPYLSHSTN